MLAPHEFELPRHAEGGWIIGGYAFAENPRYTVPQRLVRLCRHWANMRTMAQGPGSGLMPPSAAALLPVSGGYMEQPGFVLDAFQMFDHWLSERRRQDG